MIVYIGDLTFHDGVLSPPASWAHVDFAEPEAVEEEPAPAPCLCPTPPIGYDLDLHIDGCPRPNRWEPIDPDPEAPMP